MMMVTRQFSLWNGSEWSGERWAENSKRRRKERGSSWRGGEEEEGFIQQGERRREENYPSLYQRLSGKPSSSKSTSNHQKGKEEESIDDGPLKAAFQGFRGKCAQKILNERKTLLLSHRNSPLWKMMMIRMKAAKGGDRIMTMMNLLKQKM